MNRVGTIRAECEGCRRFTDVRETLLPGEYDTQDLCSDCRADLWDSTRPGIEQ